jgi:hypothetical protein
VVLSGVPNTDDALTVFGDSFCRTRNDRFVHEAIPP